MIKVLTGLPSFPPPKPPSGNNKVWLESVIAVPSNSYDDGFLVPDKIERSGEFARKCGQNHFHLDVDAADPYCRAAVISLGAALNGGALDCNCDSTGSVASSCDKIGGQCKCKENVIGRQCTRCKPGYFGFPDCKQCKCPPTAQCNEETGKRSRIKENNSSGLYFQHKN